MTRRAVALILLALLAGGGFALGRAAGWGAAMDLYTSPTGPFGAELGRHAPATPASAPPPSAAPLLQPVAAAAWSPVECQWAIATLQDDAQLDRAAAARTGDPGVRDWYLMTAGWWDQVTRLVLKTCGRPYGAGAPLATCSDALGWLDAGRSSHVHALAEPGIPEAARLWNQRWIEAYAWLKARLGSCQ
jgi:hypothetical protein